MEIDFSKITNPDIRNFLSDPANTENMAKGFLLLGVEAQNSGDWEAAIRLYQEIIRIAPTDLPSRYFGANNLAHALIMQKQFEAAIPFCNAAIQANADWYFAFKNLGLAHEGLGRYAEAARYFLNATLRGPNDKQAWLHLQKMVANHPDILQANDGLPQAIESARKFLEARGGASKLN